MHILRRSAKRYQLILVCLSGHPFVILVHTTVTWPPLDHWIATLTSMAYEPRPVLPQELFDSILDELGSPFKSENSKSARASLQSCALVCTSFRFVPIDPFFVMSALYRVIIWLPTQNEYRTFKSCIICWKQTPTSPPVSDHLIPTSMRMEPNRD